MKTCLIGKFRCKRCGHHLDIALPNCPVCSSCDGYTSYVYKHNEHNEPKHKETKKQKVDDNLRRIARSMDLMK